MPYVEDDHEECTQGMFGVLASSSGTLISVGMRGAMLSDSGGKNSAESCDPNIRYYRSFLDL